MTRNRMNAIKEGNAVKKILVLIAAAITLVALTAVPAFAEGYNTSGEYTRDNGYFSGPHGGYQTTTNKCAVCHSTHYATGSYMLLRANSRETACDFCHGGGGGSTINIQMDNAYKDMSDPTTATTGIAVTDGGSGMGTGHTLGYEGRAPADIKPAFTTDGFACFDCHTPHGNSARVLEPFGSPSRPAGEGYITDMYGASFMTTQMYRIQEMFKVKFDMGGGYYVMPGDFTKMPGTLIESTTTPALIDDFQDPPSIMALMGDWQTAGMPKAPEFNDIYAWAMAVSAAPDADGYRPVSGPEMMDLMGLFPPTLMDLMQNWYIYWGTDVDGGNIATKFWNMGDWQYNGDGTFTVPGTYSPQGPPVVEVWHKPLFPKGTFLLLKNPDSKDDVADINPMTGAPYGDTLVAGAGVTATDGVKKLAVDWDWPLGPAASWGPFFYTDNSERFPLAFPWAPKGVAMENEFCTSCHDGAAGQSNQPAEVWIGSDADAYYDVVYSHDSQSRGCARAQYLNPNDGNNFGPHCANCHTGASGCYTCHDDAGNNWNSGSAQGDGVLVEAESTYQAPASLRASAVSGVGGQCLDGGFSYPHRTLGYNMLKDELWGVDFDGSEIAANEVRMTNAEITAHFAGSDPAYSFTGFATDDIVGQATHNLDSVCIDCHGDATYWNGDDPSYFANFNSGNPLGNETWNVQGWELLLKGLP